MNIKAVVFDYGKVISFPPEDKVMDELAALASVERERFEKIVWEYRGGYDRGDLSGPEYYRKVLETLGVSANREREEKMAFIDMQGWTRINPATVNLMEGLKKAGYLVGILSNMPFDFLEWARKTLPVFNLPDVGVFSCEVRAIKPEEAIYRELLARLKCRPEELVFFDDVSDNVNKALELKINAFLWEDPEKARGQLSGLGVNP